MTPRHVAIIMDGNGRWAQGRLRPRVWGHTRGSFRVPDIVEEAENLGIECLTLFAFSTENWNRPGFEVRTLFKLLKKFVIRERERITKNGIQFRIIGSITNLPEDTKSLISGLINDTKSNTGLKLTFAFNYGGRKEIVEAVNRFNQDHPGETLTEEILSSHMEYPDLGDVDFLIRTGGDHRISNFLLWQTAYAELFFTPTKWPDFSTQEFKEIINGFSNRERRFGAVSSTDSFELSKKLAKEHQNHISQTKQE
ncbi:MAG: di-trans,poly-cis-decaprenylcistransferase [Bacteriovoracaceae bacterium]|jgi:undecaprenyl diphosphate synthase|nr:di-trans,poly-cis-decaprenylcistransferase [Bacteriovoracaceae bacterium]